MNSKLGFKRLVLLDLIDIIVVLLLLNIIVMFILFIGVRVFELSCMVILVELLFESVVGFFIRNLFIL